MRNTRRTQTGTQIGNFKNRHINSHLTANQSKPSKLEMNENNNNSCDLIPDGFSGHGRLKYHWKPNDTIMKIFRRDKSPETQELIQ